MKAALYVRVSTDRQTCENQEAKLREVARSRGWEITEVYSDKGISGAKGRAERPGLDAMLKDATAGRFGVLMAWSIDRIGRSLLDLLNIANELHALKVDLYLDQQGIDTSTPMGRMMFQMTGMFAEYERSMINERSKAGIKRARAEGVRFGRPRKCQEAAEARKWLKRGETIRQVAERTGLSVGTVHNIKSAEAAG
jgi:DNA invertase Pin-like site-specific DNA recombinase